MVQVRNTANGKTVTVRINNRGPYKKGRIIDLSKAAAEQLDMIRAGTAKVELVVVGGDVPKGNAGD
jgi:rare lipoprotein A